MSKDRMKHFLEELDLLAGCEIVPAIVRSEEVQSCINEFFRRHQLDRRNPDHTDFVLGICIEHALNDWPSGKKARDSKIFKLLEAIDDRLQVMTDGDLTLAVTQIIEERMAERLAAQMPNCGQGANAKSEPKPDRKQKMIVALRTQAKRFYDDASTRSLDLLPEFQARLPDILRRLEPAMQTRPYSRGPQSNHQPKA
jgi:hypothetical protein